ncbi:hypothetical protein GGP41_005584 [Bipolaris sorokiniana]|uniref:Isochorismatase-like domain-containing protein n=1 Tax=Cochliobolus sativus TaxID=45130 RepID=A0A8H5ZF59_COCSA|nr:hypothetical protein GGP41_005584 [Bipolaris sorokiniana]
MSMSLYSSRAMAAAAPLRLHATMTAPHHAPFLLLQRMLYRRPTLNPLKTFLVPAPRTFSSSAMAPQRIEKFRPAIYEFPKVIATAQKLLRASQVLNIPVVATTQNRARLGETCPELKLDAPDGFKTADFSSTPEVEKVLDSLNAPGPLSAIVVGIESHICITQTTLDLLRRKHKVYVIADGVSSCNKEEIPIALARLRHEGAIVTTSESFLYELFGEAGTPEFKALINIVKESSKTTKDTLQSLCKF